MSFVLPWVTVLDTLDTEKMMQFETKDARRAQEVTIESPRISTR